MITFYAKSPDPDLLSSIVQVYTRTRNIYSQAKQLHRVFPRGFYSICDFTVVFIHISSSHPMSVVFGKLWEVQDSSKPTLW